MITRCKKCLIPITRPDTFFADGICSACITHERQSLVDWGERSQDLDRLLESRKRPGAEFDCIVASSGGKDSACQVLDIMARGARPLVVTASTCYLTPLGRYNIDVLKRYATTIEVSPNSRVRAYLNRAGMSLVGDVSWPEHVAIFTTPMRVAVAFGIPLVFYGENPQCQYGGPKFSEDSRQMTQRWVSEFGGLLGLRHTDFIGQKAESVTITENDMRDYAFPDLDAISSVGVEAHFLGQYIGPWDSHRNAEIAKYAGMQQVLPSPANWWPFENLDNAMTGLHDHAMYRKYGYGRACAQVSVDIRNGLLTREQGFDIVCKRDGILPDEYAGVSLEAVLQRIGMTRVDLCNNLDRFTNHGLFSVYKMEHPGMPLRPIANDFTGC
jgi:N-acetyl sugar amidotransferase